MQAEEVSSNIRCTVRDRTRKYKKGRVHMKEAKEKVKEISKSMPANLKELQQERSLQMSVPQARAEYYVEQMMEKISPKLSVMPQPLDKTLVGIVSTDIQDMIVTQWKSKFSTVYNHRIMEIGEVDEEEEKKIIIEQNKKYD